MSTGSANQRTALQPGDPEDRSHRIGDWGTLFIQHVLHPATIAGVPSIIGVLAGYFVFRAWGQGLTSFLRSLAGVLIPLVGAGFVFNFKRDLLESLGKIRPPLAGVLAAVTSFLLMLAVEFCASFYSRIPIIELVLMTCFSVLVFSYSFLRSNRILAYYYGSAMGFLAYLWFIGSPVPLR